MKIKILLPLLFSATFFVGCGNEVRPDTYVSQPSVLLTPYNISHLRLHVNSANSAVLTFDRSTFTYDSPHYQYSGTWSSSDTPTLISGGEEMAIVTSIEYTTDDGYDFTTSFISTGFELEVGDTFILSGDHLLSGTVTQIEVNNIN